MEVIMKRIIAFLMVIVTVTIIIPGTLAFAVASHTHKWKKTAEQVNSYSNINDSTHTVNVIEYFKCTVNGCLNTITNKTSRTVSHNYAITSTKKTYRSINRNAHITTTKVWKRCACGKQITETQEKAEFHDKYDAYPKYENGLIVAYHKLCHNCDWEGEDIPYRP